MAGSSVPLPEVKTPVVVRRLLLDIDGTLVGTGERTGLNTQLLNSIEKSGIKNITFFTAMAFTTVVEEYTEPNERFKESRQGLIEELRKKGYDIEIIIPNDLVAGPGETYKALAKIFPSLPTQEARSNHVDAVQAEIKEQKDLQRKNEKAALYKFFIMKIEREFKEPEKSAVLAFVNEADNKRKLENYFWGGPKETLAHVNPKFETFLKNFIEKDFVDFRMKGELAEVFLQAHANETFQAFYFDDNRQCLNTVARIIAQYPQRGTLVPVHIDMNQPDSVEAKKIDAVFEKHYVIEGLLRNIEKPLSIQLDKLNQKISDKKTALDEEQKAKEEKKRHVQAALSAIDLFRRDSINLSNLKKIITMEFEEVKAIKHTGKRAKLGEMPLVGRFFKAKEGQEKLSKTAVALQGVLVELEKLEAVVQSRPLPRPQERRF